MAWCFRVRFLAVMVRGHGVILNSDLLAGFTVGFRVYRFIKFRHVSDSTAEATLLFLEPFPVYSFAVRLSCLSGLGACRISSSRLKSNLSGFKSETGCIYGLIGS